MDLGSLQRQLIRRYMDILQVNGHLNLLLEEFSTNDLGTRQVIPVSITIIP